ncbi:hypothetical protein E6O75_ATG07596 [Venturia nashicola]|uniref:Uncharacterized protein n=1 Tax=Venturia nashicola TaxID=86259 RepID=A0A4Z1PE38_9PEZI|nr:hypothetical protein E6O75_ATG07596 [Venturia nashicola]
MQLSRFNNCPWKDGQGASMRTARQSDLGIGWPRVKPFQCATERKQGQDQQNGSPMIWYRHSDGRFSPRLLAEAIARAWLVHLDLPHERERGPFVCSQLYPRNQFTCQQPNDSSNYISSSLRTAMVVEVVASSVLTEREQEREQIRDLKQKLQESQRIESRMDSILDENFDPIGHLNTPSRVDFCTSSSPISMISEEPPSPSSSTSIAPSPFIPRARR